MRTTTCCLGAALLLSLPGGLAAQADTATGPRVGPPVQRITTASAVSTEQLGSIVGVRELPDGRVLVSDGQRRRLLLMDTAMTVERVVLDSLTAIAESYGTRPGPLLPFRGDTTFFVDPASYAMVVLDAQGNIVRTRSVWRVQDVSYFGNAFGTYGVPGVDGRGRMVYRIPARAAPPAVRPPAGVPYFPPEPDSAFIVAVDIDTRKQDTIASIRIPGSANMVRQTGEGSWFIDQSINPLPVTDDWAVLSDGTVAIVRAIDYRIDYLKPDGTWSSSAKLPFEWVRLTDEDKERMVDSTRAAAQKQRQQSHTLQMIMWANQYAKPYPTNFRVPDGFMLMPGLPKDWILPPGVTFPANYVYACPPGVEPPTPAPMQGAAMMMATPAGAAPAQGAAPATPAQPNCVASPFMFGGGGNTPPPPQLREPSVIPALDLPDYKPPIPRNAVRADLDGNLWIRTLPPKPVPGGPVYDIVNRQGELVNRIQLLPGYTLVGFGRDKVVYVSVRDAGGLKLARVRLK